MNSWQKRKQARFTLGCRGTDTGSLPYQSYIDNAFLVASTCLQPEFLLPAEGPPPDEGLLLAGLMPVLFWVML